MPAKRGYSKKRHQKGKAYKRAAQGRPPIRSLGAPKPYYFKRSFQNVETLHASNGFWTTSGNNLAKSWGFSLNASVPSNDEFSSLFKYYKIVGARLRMYFSNTGSEVTTHSGAEKFPNSQILVTIDRNQDGDVSAVADDNLYLQSQTSRRLLAFNSNGKPLDIYMPLYQQNIVQGQDGTTLTTKRQMIKPKFISTQDAGDVSHFGYNMMLQRVDGEEFSDSMSNAQKVRILTTLYLQCKKVE